MRVREKFRNLEIKFFVLIRKHFLCLLRILHRSRRSEWQFLELRVCRQAYLRRLATMFAVIIVIRQAAGVD